MSFRTTTFNEKIDPNTRGVCNAFYLFHKNKKFKLKGSNFKTKWYTFPVINSITRLLDNEFKGETNSFVSSYTLDLKTNILDIEKTTIYGALYNQLKYKEYKIRYLEDIDRRNKYHLVDIDVVSEDTIKQYISKNRYGLKIYRDDKIITYDECNLNNDLSKVSDYKYEAQIKDDYLIYKISYKISDIYEITRKYNTKIDDISNIWKLNNNINKNNVVKLIYNLQTNKLLTIHNTYVNGEIINNQVYKYIDDGERYNYNWDDDDGWNGYCNNSSYYVEFDNKTRYENYVNKFKTQSMKSIINPKIKHYKNGTELNHVDELTKNVLNNINIVSIEKCNDVIKLTMRGDKYEISETYKLSI